MDRLVALSLALVAASAAAAPPSVVEVRTRDDIAKMFSPATRIRVVNLWATWCAPCVTEMPELQAVDDRFPEVEIVGVSLDDAIPGSRAERKKLVRKFLASRNIHFKIAYYIGKISRIADEYDFEGEIPITFILDPSGKELMRHQGVIDREEFTQKLRVLLKK